MGIGRPHLPERTEFLPTSVPTTASARLEAAAEEVAARAVSTRTHLSAAEAVDPPAVVSGRCAVVARVGACDDARREGDIAVGMHACVAGRGAPAGVRGHESRRWGRGRCLMRSRGGDAAARGLWRQRREEPRPR